MFKGTRRIQIDAGDSVGNQFAYEFASSHARVREGEEETVANLFRHVTWIGYGKTVVAEYLLHPSGTFGISLGILNKVYHAFA